ncbi:DDHD domain-containing protein [Mycotypha africana]|uniref:DDHD domain-containing protein n=1 Tax=Mycotypha africana TaxID=64632 RepID=UPI00230176CA|nr:DDHD domain-containing protein [Mycotypha africana]KAI8992097.1 DDHD domain-containing protein [Mycotypha africana]
MKGGLKGVLDASFNVGTGIATRAGAMYESLKMGLTTNLFMRGLGLSRQQIYEDMHPEKATTSHQNTMADKLQEFEETEDGIVTTSTATTTHAAVDVTEGIIFTNGISTDDNHHRLHKLTRVRSNSDPFSNISASNSSSNSSIGKESLQKKKSTGNVLRSSSPAATPTVASLKVASPAATAANTQSVVALKGAERLKMLNATGRVDYCLQEGFLENPYLSAFSAHMQYWQDLDVAAFLVKQIYLHD